MFQIYMFSANVTVAATNSYYCIHFIRECYVNMTYYTRSNIYIADVPPPKMPKPRLPKPLIHSPPTLLTPPRAKQIHTSHTSVLCSM